MPNDHVPHPDPDNRNKEIVYLRIPLDLLARIEAHREVMKRDAASGVEVTRSAAIRNLIAKGLDA